MKRGQIFKWLSTMTTFETNKENPVDWYPIADNGDGLLTIQFMNVEYNTQEVELMKTYEATVDADGNWAVCTECAGDVIVDMMTEETAKRVRDGLNTCPFPLNAKTSLAIATILKEHA